MPRPALCFTVLLLCFTIVCSANSFGQQTPGTVKPNIVLFLVDDMGWLDTSVPFSESRTWQNDHFRTPNMLRLAKSGVTFTNAYSAAVCSPTRTSIMTGQNPARHHVTNWTLFKGKDTSHKDGSAGSPRNWNTDGLQPSAALLPEVLRKNGYFTIHCGKAHWGANGTAGKDPTKLGFDVNIAGHAAGGPGSYQGKNHYGNLPKKDGTFTPWGVPGLEEFHGTDTHLTDALTMRAKMAVTQAVEAKKPFYLYMAHYAIHAPIQPHARFMKHYQGKKYKGTEIEVPPAEQKYASMVQGMDDSLGQIMDHIEKLGQAENTLIIFTSDNGGLSVHARGKTPLGTNQDTHNWPLRAGKGSAYEGGTRIPYIVSWQNPNQKNLLQKNLPLQAGTRNNQPIICEDLYPTICHVTGSGKFIPAGHPVDGKSSVGFWLDKERDPKRPLLFHYPHVWGPRHNGYGYQPHSSLRLGNQKVIFFYDTRTWELFDLVNDLSEEKNLAEPNPELLNKMKKKLLVHLKKNNAQWPVDRKSGKEIIPK